jgi:hypothetical protein
MTFPLYHLDVKIERCTVHIKLNDLTIVELTGGDTPEWFAPPLNPYLVGDGNLLSIDVYPAPDTDIARANVEIVVRVYDKGDNVAPGSGPVVIAPDVNAEISAALEEARERGEEIELPLSFMHVFDNEGPTFTAELNEADPITDEGALRDYAIVLRDLMAARDAGGLGEQMAPKVTAYAIAFDDDPTRIEQGLAHVLANEYAPRGFETDFTRDDVILLPQCGGRIWELRRPGNRPLIQTPIDAEESSMQIPTYVGRTPDGLRIVR